VVLDFWVGRNRRACVIHRFICSKAVIKPVNCTVSEHYAVHRNSVLLDLIAGIGVRAIFSRGAEPSLPEKFSDIARKTAMLTCKLT